MAGHFGKLFVTLLHPELGLGFFPLGLQGLTEDLGELGLGFGLVGQHRGFPGDPELDAGLFHPEGQFDVGVLGELVVFLHSVVGRGEEEVGFRGERAVHYVADFRGVVGRRVGRKGVGYEWDASVPWSSVDAGLNIRCRQPTLGARILLELLLEQADPSRSSSDRSGKVGHRASYSFGRGFA